MGEAPLVQEWVVVRIRLSDPLSRRALCRFEQAQPSNREGLVELHRPPGDIRVASICTFCMHCADRTMEPPLFRIALGLICTGD